MVLVGGNAKKIPNASAKVCVCFSFQFLCEYEFFSTVLMLVASLPCALCTHFGELHINFLSVDALDKRCVCSVYPIWGHQSYMYREGSPFYKILAVIFRLSINYG